MMHRTLATIALTLGTLAVLSSARPAAEVPLDRDKLASTIEREEDHVTAMELAAWLRARKPGLRVIDLRSADEFDVYRIPRAENLSITDTVHASFREGDTVVLYSGAGAHAAQAWVLLRSRGVKSVYFLRGGLDEWLRDVMSPAIASDATPDQKAAFRATSEMSRYFGGTPRVVPGGGADGARKQTAVPTAEDWRRRGC